MKQREHYLLTGASGFLGGVINDILKQQDMIVSGLDLFGQSLTVDITRPFILDIAYSPDIVVHAAGKAHSIPRNNQEEQVFYDVNFHGTVNLCNALSKLAVKPTAFIFISTVAVYGVQAGSLIPESHPLNGETPYAKSKILAEKWLDEWAEQNNILLGILRLPLIAGPNPPGNLGAMINGIRTGKYLSIGRAEARKSVVWQEDIATIIPSLSKTGGTYNLTDGYHPSFKELEGVISSALKKRKPVTIPTIFARVLAVIGDFLGNRFPINTDKLNKITATLTFDDTLARKELGWNPSSVLLKLSKAL